MSSRKKDVDKKKEEDELTKNQYRTSKGEILELVGISPMFIAELQNSTQLPKPPIRKVQTDIDDYEEEEELTEETIETEEEQVQWNKYRQELQEALQERHSKFTRAVFARGVNVDPKGYEVWEQELEYWGIEVPDHPIDKKIKYIQSELVGDADDIINIILKVLSLTGVPEEEMKTVEGMFRRAVRRDPTSRTKAAEG